MNSPTLPVAADLTNLRAAVAFLDQMRTAAAAGDDVTRTGIARDAREWLEKAARDLVASATTLAAPEGTDATPSPKAPHYDDIAVDQFATFLKGKLAAERLKGRGGWQSKDDCSADHLSAMLREHVAKGDPCDVAILCMFLHHRREVIVPEDARSMSREEWVEEARQAYIDAGDDAASASEQAAWLWTQQDLLSGELDLPLAVVQEDLHCRPRPASAQVTAVSAKLPAPELPDRAELEAWRSTAEALLGASPDASAPEVRRAALLLQNAHAFASRLARSTAAA